MILKVKCGNGSTIAAGTVVRIPFKKDGDERMVYATFEGVQGNTKVRKIGIALTKSPRTTKAVNILNILDGDTVKLGRSTIFYPGAVPFSIASDEEVATYQARVAKEVKERGLEK